MITELLGGSPAERPERYRAASPVELLPFGGRQSFLAGRMFGGQVTRYEDAARRAGDAVQTTVVADAGHFVFIDPLSDMWPTVRKSVRHALSMPE